MPTLSRRHPAAIALLIMLGLFVTGFVVGDNEVWGRPVGVTVARDGALLVSEDGNGTIWRISHE
mgnify:CR=1 FL=1